MSLSAGLLSSHSTVCPYSTDPLQVQNLALTLVTLHMVGYCQGVLICLNLSLQGLSVMRYNSHKHPIFKS